MRELAALAQATGAQPAGGGRAVCVSGVGGVGGGGGGGGNDDADSRRLDRRSAPSRPPWGYGVWQSAGGGAPEAALPRQPLLERLIVDLDLVDGRPLATHAHCARLVLRHGEPTTAGTPGSPAAALLNRACQRSARLSLDAEVARAGTRCVAGAGFHPQRDEQLLVRCDG